MDKSQLTVVLDLDGVALDFITQWVIACEEYLQREVTVKNYVYALSHRYGLTAKEFEGAWSHFHTAGHWERIPERAEAIKHINAMHNMGIDIHLVSAASNELIDARRSNLTDLGLSTSVPLHCTGGYKFEKLSELQPLIFVDDHDLHLSEAREAGILHRIQILNSEFDAVSEHATKVEDDLRPVVSLATRLYSQNLYEAINRKENKVQPFKFQAPNSIASDMQGGS